MPVYRTQKVREAEDAMYAAMNEAMTWNAIARIWGDATSVAKAAAARVAYNAARLLWHAARADEDANRNKGN